MMKDAVVGLCLMLLLRLIATSTAMPAPAPTSPAFLWSPHLHQKEAVNYRTLSSKDLANAVLGQGGWSNFLCSQGKLQQPLDVALMFVGSELLSTDICFGKSADPTLVDILKVSFTKSNFSVAFPYVAASEENMEKALISGLTETCGQELGLGKVAFTESCSVDGEKFDKLANLDDVHDYLSSKLEKGTNGKAKLVVVCHGLDQSRKESEVLSELISSVEKSGVKYSALYVSNPFQSIQYPSYRELERFLAEGAQPNASLNSTTCDELCHIKSSLLEGVFVGIVLLIILVSGLCCMMGIDTPTRFETPQES